MKKKKLTFEIISKYRGLLMGIAIISILIFHYTEDCQIAKYHYEGLIKIYKACVGSSGVDIFLLLSGLGLYYSFKKNSNTKEFYKKRFIRVLIPYFLVATPAILINSLAIQNTGIVSALKELSFISLFTEGKVWFWYIFFICVCYLIFPYIFKVFDTSKDEITDHQRLITLFSFITLICLMLSLYCKPLFSRTQIFTLRFFPFIAGVLIGKYSYQKKEIKLTHILLALCGLGCVIFVRNHNVMITRYALFILNSCLLFLGIIIFDKLSNLKIHPIISKIGEWFGKYSLEIYLVHVALRKFFKELGYPTHLIKNEIVFIILSLVVSLVLNKVVNYINKKIEKRTA